jgi:hypothetical protein
MYTNNPAVTSGCKAQCNTRIQIEPDALVNAAALRPDFMSKCPKTTKIDEAQKGTHQWLSSPRRLLGSHFAASSISKGDATASVLAMFEFIEGFC